MSRVPYSALQIVETIGRAVPELVHSLRLDLLSLLSAGLFNPDIFPDPSDATELIQYDSGSLPNLES
jgi:hypothetical protein